MLEMSIRGAILYVAYLSGKKREIERNMSNATPVVGTILGVAGIGAVVTYFCFNPEKAQRLADAAVEGLEKMADSVIENVPEWIQNNLGSAAHDLMVKAGLMNSKP